jgi:hypothetical protein
MPAVFAGEFDARAACKHLVGMLGSAHHACLTRRLDRLTLLSDFVTENVENRIIT